VRPDNILHVLPKRDQETQKPFHRELTEIPPQHLGNIGLADAKQTGCVHLLHPPSRGILNAHRRFGYLKRIDAKQQERDTTNDVRLVLDGFRGMFDRSKEPAMLCRSYLRKATNGRVTKKN
jgi:hypothetical protein